MSPPGNDFAPCHRGEVGKAATSARGFSRDNSLHVKRDNVIPFRGSQQACLCGGAGQCLVCRRWARTISGVQQRRADSLKLQAMGALGRAGGW